MKRLTIRPMLMLMAVAITALALVQVASARPEPQARTSATTISVSGKEFSFKLSKKSISRPGKVTFKFKNNGTVLHDFSINHKKTRLIGPHRCDDVCQMFKRGRRPPPKPHPAFRWT